MNSQSEQNDVPDIQDTKPRARPEQENEVRRLDPRQAKDLESFVAKQRDAMGFT